jgi:WD40 repeat protein
LVTGTHIHELNGHTARVNNLAVTSDCERVYVGCADSKLYLYNLKTSQLLSIIIDQHTGINDLVISVDNCFLFSSSGNSLYVINLKKPINNTIEHKDMYENSLTAISCFDISQEGDLAITGDEHGRIMLWNLVDGILGETIMTHDKEATCVNLCNSYLFSISASKDCTVKVFDNEQQEKVTEFKEHKAPIRHLMILEGNEKILSADEDNFIKIWYADTGQLIDSISVACQMLCCSPDGKYVVSGSGDNT